MVINRCKQLLPTNRSALFLGVICLIGLFMNPFFSNAQTPEQNLTIETIGTAPVNDEDVVSAEQTATKNALQSAIDEGVAAILSPEILADNFEQLVTTFYGSAETFILNYKKLALATGDDYCRVLVRSSILAGDIEKRIKQAGIMIDRESPPRLLILLGEYRTGQAASDWWRENTSKVRDIAEKAMAANFSRRGMLTGPHDRQTGGMTSVGPLDDLSDEEALEIGRNLAVDFVIVGRTTLILPEKFTPQNSGDVLGVIDARLLDVDTGGRIFRVSLQRPVDDTQVPPDILSAISSAAKAAARQFSPAVVAAFEQQKNRSHVFQIRIQGVGYLAHLNAFRNFLDTIKRITRANINEMEIGEAVISIDFVGNIRELAKALAETPSNLLSIKVTDVLTDTVVIELGAAGAAADMNETGESFKP